MVSDDTEQSALLLDALIVAGGRPEAMARAFGWRLRWWLLGLPAGTGMATARAIARLWAGVPATRAGVRSAGNGAAMRAPVLGAVAVDVDELVALVTASTAVTHTDPRALHGALVVAVAAWVGGRDGCANAEAFARELACLEPLRGSTLLAQVSLAIASATRGEATEAFAGACGLADGVTGFVEHTVPVAVHAWLAHPASFTGAVQAVIRCGGDADTTAAIVGGMTGATLGEGGIDQWLLDGLMDWPLSVANLRRLARAVSTGTPAPAIHLPLRLPRNLLFLVIVLLHGLRRLAPPY